MKLAGVSYTWGREATSTYNESLAGVRSPGFSGVSGPQHVDALYENGTLSVEATDELHALLGWLREWAIEGRMVGAKPL